MRVAVATHGDVIAVARAPYVRTLWTFLHMCQQERLESIRDRARALSLATLIMLAYHKPIGLQDVQRQLRDEAGFNPPIDQVIAEREALLADIAKLDAIERAPAMPGAAAATAAGSGHDAAGADRPKGQH